MKLFHTINSPYARRARMAVRESGLSGQVEEIEIIREENNDLLFEQGPGGKVPGLLTDSGTYLCESLIIARYLDEVSGGKLYPADPAAREFALHVESVASLLMDSLYVRAAENRRDPSEQSPGLIEKEAARAARCYDELAGLVERFDGQVSMDKATVVASLGYADWRHPGDGWRDGRPKLAAWFEEMMKRPAMADTKPIF
jgi:glutathione S-transferase